MSVYVAFLRAVNVAGHGVVKMDALCGAFTAAGCRNVRSYIQSGNIVFESSGTDKNLPGKLLRELKALLGHEPGICLRSVDELQALVDREPFAPFNAEKKSKFYVAFLVAQSGEKLQFPLLWPKEGLEAFGMSGREVYVVSRPSSQGAYGFPNGFIEKALGVPATTRNWNTINRIVKFAEGK